MDITLYISRFLYRIRHQLIFGTLIVTALVAYFSQFMEKKVHRDNFDLHRYYLQHGFR